MAADASLDTTCDEASAVTLSVKAMPSDHGLEMLPVNVEPYTKFKIIYLGLATQPWDRKSEPQPLDLAIYEGASFDAALDAGGKYLRRRGNRNETVEIHSRPEHMYRSWGYVAQLMRGSRMIYPNVHLEPVVHAPAFKRAMPADLSSGPYTWCLGCGRSDVPPDALVE
jgi:hypothetical protein